MRIASACIYALNIPFVESFSHSLFERDCCDSVLVKLTTDCGVSGFGEGVPRAYVTGETRQESVQHIADRLLPGVIGADLGDIDTGQALTWIDGLLPRQDTGGPVVWNASRGAVELALLDCLFRSRAVSVNTILPARLQHVTYSGVITAGSVARTEELARRCKAAGLEYLKIKVREYDDLERIALVRDLMGPSVSIRLDANGAFGVESARRFLTSAAQYDIECVEQPIPPGDLSGLAALRSASPIPVMADESVITMEDAKELIDRKAVDYFNLRISKCGGLHQTLAIAGLARASGVGIQLGCHVGETAILSAAGRHLAAYLADVRFVEGSYGAHLLEDDISAEDLRFGPGGKAPILAGPGLGVTVREDLLDKYAIRVASVC